MVSDNHPVREVLKKIVADASINVDQVRELDAFVAEDWVIDGDEAEFLFRVNQALGDNQDDCPEWTQFFIHSVCRFVVLDMNTPGEINQSEGDWLGEMFDRYSVANESERKLVFELEKTTTSIKGKILERIQSPD